MNIYFITFLVKPTIEHQLEHLDQVYCYCWIKAYDSNHSINLSNYLLERYHLKVLKIIKNPIISSSADINNNEFYKYGYNNALNNGIGIILIDELGSESSSNNFIKLNTEEKIDINKILKTSKIFRTKGHCLHYNAGDECKDIIDSHSISKSILLKKIDRNGFIYRLSIDYLNKNNSNQIISYKLKGINKASIFPGFCSFHDNQLFSLIDNNDFDNSNEQASLYSYRSICRELFLKEKAIKVLEERIKIVSNTTDKQLLFKLLKGTKIGLKNILLNKQYYDNSLKENVFDDIRFVLFLFDNRPNIVFSCSYFPDVDYLCDRIQLLGNPSVNLQCISFCSVPIGEKWGFLFCWHKNNNKICNHFMNTLATVIYKNPDLTNTLLFRLLMQCENTCISPNWWESLSINNQKKIIDYQSKALNQFYPIYTDYLINDLDNIIDWKPSEVIQNY